MHNLPAQPTQLLGREHDIAAARELLQSSPVRLLTLLGHGGVGKTRLAIALAESVAESFPGGVVFVDLAPLAEADQVGVQIASTLGLHDSGDCSIPARLQSALHDRAMLLLLDNFEHVAPAATLLAGLLGSCPQVKILVTSRVPLQMRWEYQCPVTPLAVPDLQQAPSWTEVAQYAAVRLFVERARMVQPDFHVTERNAAIIAAICAALDGLPLAIELAAARVKSLSLAAIRDWLSDTTARRPLQLLATSCPDLPARHLSLRAAIDWSYRLLTANEQAIFRQLSVFAGSFSLEAAELLIEHQDAVGDGLEEERNLQIFDVIASLVDKNLLMRRPETGASEEREARYQMLQTIRDFGLEQLVLTDELRDVQRRHAYLFATLAEGAEREQNGPTETIWFNRLAGEWDNLRAALNWCLDNDPGTGLRLAGSLDRFWEAHDEVGEGRQWLEALLSRAGSAGPEVLAKALSAAGTMAWRRCDFSRAIEWHRQSLDLYRSCDDQHGYVLALNNLGVQYSNLGEAHTAAAYYEECITRSRAIHDAQAEIVGLTNLGILAMDRRELHRARDLFQEALVRARALGSDRSLASVLNNLGEVSLGLGDIQAARACQRECIQRTYDCGLKVQLAFSLEGIAGVYRAMDMSQKAARLVGAADSLRETLKVPVNPAYRQGYYDAMCQAIQNTLGASAFAAARSAGRAAPLADIVAEALADGNEQPPAAGTHSSAATAAGCLSAREREVAALVARGQSNREIAGTLVITEGTAANHIAHIMNKLDCRSRAQIAAWAVRHGLLSAPESQ